MRLELRWFVEWLEFKLFNRWAYGNAHQYGAGGGMAAHYDYVASCWEVQRCNVCTTHWGRYWRNHLVGVAEEKTVVGHLAFPIEIQTEPDSDLPRTQDAAVSTGEFGAIHLGSLTRARRSIQSLTSEVSQRLLRPTLMGAGNRPLWTQA